MKGFSRQIIPTEDGSHTVSIPDLGITYHSNRGAIQESVHVFIEAGLKTAFGQFPDAEINVLEMGFGTGLNAFLTAITADTYQRKVNYTTLEQYPITNEEAAVLNYPITLGNEAVFAAMHDAECNRKVAITPNFILEKIKDSLIDVSLNGNFHAIYFDAFAPETQPELWTEEIFLKLLNALADGGVLTTYCSKSSVRHAMTAAGFTVKKIPGPLGKREMVQAFKQSTIKGE